jgi:hypothetical protein
MTVEHHCDRETVVKKVVVSLLRFRTPPHMCKSKKESCRHPRLLRDLVRCSGFGTLALLLLLLQTPYSTNNVLRIQLFYPFGPSRQSPYASAGILKKAVFLQICACPRMPVSQLAKEGRRRGSPQSHRRPQPFENHNRPTFFIRKCGWGERLEDSFAEIILRTIPTRVGRTRIVKYGISRDADHPHAGGENDHCDPVSGARRGPLTMSQGASNRGHSPKARYYNNPASWKLKKLWPTMT